MTQHHADAARRPRDSAATRRALLAAAQELFAAVGYDATTVRAVADRAGVNQALLFRYFGNKRGLFTAAVQDEVLAVLDGPPADLLGRTLDAMLDGDGDDGGEHGTRILMAMLRAAGSEQLGEQVRQGLGAAYTRAFAAQTDTDDPHDSEVRGQLLLAWLLGLAVARSVLPDGPLHDAGAVRAHVTRAAAELLRPGGSEPDAPETAVTPAPSVG